MNFELVRYCLSQGIQIHVISETLSAELVDVGAIWHRIKPRVLKPELIHCIDFRPRAGKVIDEISHDVDLVVANGAVLWRPHALNICHFVHGAWLRSASHDSQVHGGPYGWYQGLYSRCNAGSERRVFGLAKCVVAVSAKVQGELLEIGVPESKVKVVINGVDLEEFCPGIESRAALGLPPGSPLALFVGDIRTPRKNLETVLQSLRQIPSLQLAVVGETRQSPFPEMANSLGLSHRVHFLGYRRDVPRLMRACDLFVFPSRYEACSLALLEALASGLPVVTAVTAGGSELITPDCGQVLADPDDCNALVSAIQRFLPMNVNRSARVAAREVAEQHSWSRMSSEYLRLFEGLIRQTPLAYTTA